MTGFAGSGDEDSASDASQLSGDSDSELDEYELDEDDDPLAGATFDMSDGEAAEDQSIPSGDDESPDESSPEVAAEAAGGAQHLAKGRSNGGGFDPWPVHMCYSCGICGVVMVIA